MKKKTIGLMVLLSGFLFQGCIAFPPLIQVEHKEASADSNKELMKRLDTIDERLSQLEKSDKK